MVLGGVQICLLFFLLVRILNNRPIKVFNVGDMLRDFTYIDDIVEGVLRVIDHVPEPNLNWNDQNPETKFF